MTTRLVYPGKQFIVKNQPESVDPRRLRGSSQGPTQPRGACRLVASLASIVGLAMAVGASAAEVTQEAKLLPSNPGAEARMGESVDIDGDTLVAGASFDSPFGFGSGSAYVYQRDPGGATPWVEVKKLTAPDGGPSQFFGFSVALDGDTIAVGSDPVETVYLFERDEGGPDNWGFVQQVTWTNGSFFGWSLDVEGDILVVGAQLDSERGFRAGAAVVYERDETGTWQFAQKIWGDQTDEDDFFGGGVDIGGGRIVASAGASVDSGYANVFEKDPGTGLWTDVARLEPSGEGECFEFIATDGETVVVGEDRERVGNINPGVAFVYERNHGGPNNWGESAVLTASDGQDSDRFGRSVDVQGGRLLVGASQTDFAGTKSGAVYVFERDPNGEWEEIVRVDGEDVGETFGISVSLDGNNFASGATGAEEQGPLTGAVYVYLRGPQLFTSGDCPGPSTFGLVGATPNALAGLAWSFLPGAFSLPGGLCAGLDLGLEQPKPLNVLPADENGEVRFDFTAPTAICDLSIQAIDLTDCEASNVTTVSDP